MSPKMFSCSPQTDNPVSFLYRFTPRNFSLGESQVKDLLMKRDTASFEILKLHAVHNAAEVPHWPAPPGLLGSERLDHRCCTLEGKSILATIWGPLPTQCALKLHVQHHSPHTTLPAVPHWQWCEPALPGASRDVRIFRAFGVKDQHPGGPSC